jgi:hypothetical protein
MPFDKRVLSIAEGLRANGMVAASSRRYRLSRECEHFPMIGLSVAVGRFIEALFWAILRVAGTVAVAVVAAALVLTVIFILIRRWRRRRIPLDRTQ